MTRAVLYRDPDGRLTGFSIKGHSGYAEEGSDIVCAAISTLCITCVNSLESVADVVPTVSGGTDGKLKATLPRSLDKLHDHDAQILMKALHQGLSDLAEAYPKYVSLSITERREIP